MKKIVVILTACLLLLGLTVSVAAQTTPKANTVDYDDLDYSENVNKAATFQMGDVLDQIDGVTVSTQEKNYIRYQFTGQQVLYYTKPTGVNPNCSYNGETRELTVELADCYQYFASKDKDIVWIPSRVSAGTSVGEFRPAPDLGDNYYRAVIPDVSWAASMSLSVEYSAEFNLSPETLNDFVNFAYENALLLDGEFVTFEVESKLYEAAKLAYDRNAAEWEQYRSDYDKYELHQNSVALYRDYVAYQGFLEQVAVYNTQHEAFLENQREWDRYYDDCDIFSQYLDYKNNRYPGLLATYQSNLNTVQNHLYLLSLIEQPDPKTGVSFAAMMIDDRVAEMIEAKQTVLSAFVKRSTIDKIIDSTAALKTFCLTYRSLTTDQERYEFYIREYAGFVKHLTQLYDSIQELYNTKAVYQEMQKDYSDRIVDIVRMMGSLYVQSRVFNDNLTMNLNEIVDARGNQTAGMLVDASVRPESDTNKATPLSAWPVAPMDPESYSVRTQPTAPSQTLQDATYPTLPEFTSVSHPDEIPGSMSDPGYMAEPRQPEVVEHPGPAPVLNWNETQKQLHEAYTQGLIVQRDAFAQAQTVTMSTEVKKTIYLGEGERYYFVYFYNTDDQNTYLGHSIGVLEGGTASIPAEFASATKAPETAIAYEFVEWLDKDGNPLDLTNMTDDVYAYASYRPVPRMYQVSFVVGNGTVVQYHAYGTTPVYEGSTDKDETPQHEFTFVGWDKPFVPVTGDVTYYAQYQTSENRHKVEFVMGDGSVVEREYVYGWNLSDVVSALPTPYKAPDAQYTYTFKGWSDQNGNFYSDNSQFPLLQGPVTFTSVFDQTLNAYTVTWVVDGESIPTTWLYGEMPTFGTTADQVPTKQPEDRIVYIFDGWDKQVQTVTADVIYVAQFKPGTRYYRIDFIVDGKEYTFELEFEQMPVFGETPLKQSDVQYDYTFVGWDKEPVPARADAVYVAEFGKVLRKYPVKFVVGGNETTIEFEYGATPVYPNGTPVKADDHEFTYRFVEWDHALAPVDGSAVTYIARFDAVALAPSHSGENGKLTVGADGKFLLTIGSAQADVSLVLQKAGSENAQLLEIMLDGAVVVLNKSQIDAYFAMGDGIGSVTLEKVEQGGRAAYRLSMQDASGTPLAYLVSELEIRLPYNGVYSADVYRAQTDGTLTKLQAEHKEGYLVFSTMDFATFVLVDKYQIAGAPTENGEIDVVGEAYAGDVVTITPDPNEGYHVDTVTVTCNGQELEVELVDGKYTFLMPSANVQITTTFKVVEGGTGAEVVVGVITALLIVTIGFVIAIVLRRKKTVKV